VCTVQALLRGEQAEWEGAVIEMMHPAGFGAARPVEVPWVIGCEGPNGQAVARELGMALCPAWAAEIDAIDPALSAPRRRASDGEWSGSPERCGEIALSYGYLASRQVGGRAPGSVDRPAHKRTRPMDAHGTLISRNRDYADAYQGGRPALEPTLRTLVLCCADHRVDPAHALGLQPNEAIVLRNPGGRLTQSVLDQLTVLATIGLLEGVAVDFELVLMQHTDCGLSHLSPIDQADLLATMFGIDPSEVSARHIGDPAKGVATDVELLRANPLLPRGLVVSGLVYDVDNGLVETIVSPAPLGA